MTKPVRLAFVGKAGVGKTTAAEHVMKKYGCQKISLAEPVKEIAKVRDRLTSMKDTWEILYQMAFDFLAVETLYERLPGVSSLDRANQRVSKAARLANRWLADLDESQSRRELLQRIGTDSGRAVDPEIWVRLAEKKIRDAGDDTPLVVDDVRFPNEAEMLKRHGFVIVSIGAHEWICQQRLKKRDGVEIDLNEQAHASETQTALIPVNIAVSNNGSLEAFFSIIDTVVTRHFGIEEEDETMREDVMTTDPASQDKVPVRPNETMKLLLNVVAELDLKEASYDVYENPDGTYTHTFDFTTKPPKEE